MRLAGSSTNDLWRAIAGASAKPGDTDQDLLRRIVGVSAKPGDSFNDLLRRWTGVSAKAGDSNWDLLRKKLSTATSPSTFRDLLAQLARIDGFGALTSDSSITSDSTSVIVE